MSDDDVVSSRDDSTRDDAARADEATKSRPPGGRLFRWVEDKLEPIFTTPAAGTYNAAETTQLTDCPICGRAMSEHTIDHSTSNTVLNCPVPHPGAWDRDAFEPVNEFGMVVRTPTEDSTTG
ncbi:hypothetical protein [Glaciibacter superstes]|uniref:hypothetical protein n=1 Tax=Glaciibacter superstes TaxID=501023 RepID=UPI0012F8E966|nr:hypothetical protein [Glaciibacter superstes]